MQKKVYPQSFKDEVVKFYLTNHTIAETIRKYGIAESTLFEWRKRYNEQHYLSTNTSPRLKNWRQKELHLSKKEDSHFRLRLLRGSKVGTYSIDATIKKSMKSRAFGYLRQFHVHP